MRRVVIIGAGASGMMAAIAAADCGADVRLFEKSDRIGRKLLATGNGRCNITNRVLASSAYHGSCKSLLRPVFGRFGLRETTGFFASIGIPFRAEGDRLYPYNLQASSVQDALRYEIGRRKNIEVLCSSPVKAIRPAGAKWRVALAEGNMEKDNEADAVILTSGGSSSGQLGSAGEGFALCGRLGIRVTPLMPSLVRLSTDSPYRKRLSGVKVLGQASVSAGDSVYRTEEGEILFTDEGVSGPPVLQLSRTAGTLLAKGKKPVIRIDQFPETDLKTLTSRLTGMVRTLEYKSCEDAFNGLLHKKIIPVMLLELGIARDRKAGTLGAEEIPRIARFLKDWRFTVTGNAGFRDSQVTAGGVHRQEVGENLESVRYKGLFFAGEVLDIDGDCGGYNLQWAWSSGYVAGRGAANGEG